MGDALVVGAVRSAVGRRGGALAGRHPADLLGEVLAALAERTGIDPAEIDDVIVGCVDQVGEQGVNVGRSAVLAAGFPDTVPATTIDRQCGSSQQAAHFAAQGVMAGAYDLVVAAGVESMTRVPMWANVPDRSAAYGTRMRARYDLGDDGFIEQGESGEIVADRWGLTREELDAFALRSHRRAAAARDAGRFDDEIVPLRVVRDDGESVFAADEGIRDATTAEALAGLRPVFRADGRLTAGSSSQISDGAAALLIASEGAAARLGLRPRARFHSFAVAGVDPVEMLTGPIPATRRLLERSGVSLDEIGLVEVNEAFASIPLAWARELGADMDRVNVNGGAIALGHPLGATGARLMVSLVHEMERAGTRYGLQAMCEGGGMANATLLERIPA
ncbi:thiolase family protein [Miltoncostaea oceani]|uniref:thiolase family protein n=1 Tax=Miltoncostaea oceani TaxID=2843216 RepID=UPI001C3D071D|nr:thiolase family protein [Miltoncostaea oceani]